jgi:hypothetical protein
MNYNTRNLYIEYKTNKEYRQVIREVFNQDCSSQEEELNKYDLDEESYDEMLYDNNTMLNILDTIYLNTKSHYMFQTLYDLAAAKMMSINREIGLSVLYSYDYFYLMHICLCIYLDYPEQFNEACPYYIELIDKLKKK